MGQVTIRKAAEGDARSLAPRLRDADREELILSSGEDLTATLVSSIDLSDEAFVAVEDGVVIALWGFGVSIDGPRRLGIPWFVGSPECLRHPIKIVAIGKECVARWEKVCDVQFNYTHVGNTRHHRWLERIGFNFFPGTFPIGDSGAPFRQFYRHSNNV